MDIFKSVANHLRTIGLSSPRLTSNGVQIIQEDDSLSDNDKDVAVQGVATGAGAKDLARNRSLPFMVQILVKNTSQKQAFDDAWKIANSFDKLPRQENNKWVTLQSEDGSFLFESSEVYTQPRNLGKTEHNAYIYVLSIRLNIEL